MPRIARKDMNTSFFHVIAQGVNKEYIFKDDKYKYKYLQFVKEANTIFNLDIIAYVIMSNHVHLLIHTECVRTLSDFMKKVNENYGRYYNFMENRVGHIFRDRFLSEPIYYQKYLMNCIAYIHNNPVKANIVDKCQNYKFSSYSDYINKTGFINGNIIKLIFGKEKLDFKEYEALHVKKSYYFLEYDNILKENMKELLKEIQEEYAISIYELVKKPKYLKIISLKIKERIKISNRKLAEFLNVDVNKLYRMK